MIQNQYGQVLRYECVQVNLITFDWMVQFEQTKFANHTTVCQALELYEHFNDAGDEAAGERLEYDNLAYLPNMSSIIKELHDQLVDVVEQSLVPPMFEI